MKAGAIILSGGKSSRMGTNKALLELNDKTNIQRIFDEINKLTEHIVLVTNEPEMYDFLKIKTVADVYEGKGPLAGLHAGLLASESEVNLAVACDMPFVTAEAAEVLLKNIQAFDAVVPVINGKRHPLFAAFDQRIIPQIEQVLEAGELRMMNLLEKLNVNYITEKDFQEFSASDLERIFFNMNLPEEYKEARKWSEQ
ncbi:MAG: molybdenum cofactor guanylyltransferase [Bacillota bacterium]|nr:molybdenum cofactor guanylyltransferase [Bacillota bacterium]MDP4169441.1 molybdenum cofactor guanylyltransferase [Bacillota bacterium]